MSKFRLSFPAWILAGKSRLSAEDVMTLRRVSFSDGIRTSEDAALLLAIHHSCPEKCDEWDAFFIEALTDFAVNRTLPQGSLNDVNVAWLVQVLSSDGVIHSPTDFEVLMHVIETSSNVPASLSAFAIDQVRYALTDGIGAYRHLRVFDSRGVTRHDVDFMRYVLRSSTGKSGIILSESEIDALERIDQATVAYANDAQWAELRDAVRLHRQKSAGRGRWLRVPDEMFVDNEAAA
ncbi:hypothetical protein [Rhizobium sp. HT1-10]|uniref:hypothetical protein n=1 Tax=Rhizobium sp. HT1-10 TaxID=3111638 RepID=UPI003C2B36B3